MKVAYGSPNPAAVARAACPVCGETAPTGWICLARLAGSAEQGEPCNYSVEGNARLEAEIEAAIGAAPALLSEGRR